MNGHSSVDVTQLLNDWCRGDPAALGRLTPLVQDKLHRLPHRYTAREPAGHTLQTTAAVSEAYLWPNGAGRIPWQNHAYFFAVSARLMRRTLVELAHSRGCRKLEGDR